VIAFVTDVYSRRIVGWNITATLRAEIRRCKPSTWPTGRSAATSLV